MKIISRFSTYIIRILECNFSKYHNISNNVLELQIQHVYLSWPSRKWCISVRLFWCVGLKINGISCNVPAMNYSRWKVLIGFFVGHVTEKYDQTQRIWRPVIRPRGIVELFSHVWIHLWNKKCTIDQTFKLLWKKTYIRYKAVPCLCILTDLVYIVFLLYDLYYRLLLLFTLIYKL